MAEESSRSNSPVFDVDDGQRDITLNLNEQRAIIDNDVLMDDAMVIENSDIDLDNSIRKKRDEHDTEFSHAFPVWHVHAQF